MPAQVTAGPTDRQAQSRFDPRLIPDLLRAELDGLDAVVHDVRAILDAPNGPPAGPLLATAVAVRSAARELAELRDRLKRASVAPCRGQAA